MAESSDFDRISMIVLRQMRGPLFLLISVYAIGIAGFGMIPGVNGEPMSIFHALYFLSYTATTTGFGEIPNAFSNAQRIWAIVLLHVSVIAWLVSIGAIIRLMRNVHFKRAVSRNLFARRVARKNQAFVIICGFGDAGSLLARALNEQGFAVVVIDNDEDRIKALSLRNFVISPLGVCADSSNPGVLLDAGLRHPLCQGIAAVTDDEHVNTQTAVMTRALNSKIQPLCRVDTESVATELNLLRNVRVIDSFKGFADQLCIALYRPALYALGDWLLRVPNATLDHRPYCPAGKWIICGYGRMGHRMEKNLLKMGVDVTVLDPKLPETRTDKQHIRGSANHETLKQAGIEDAAAVFIATDSDTNNLRIMMIVNTLNADVFTVMRQNQHSNEVVFSELPVGIIMHPDRMMSRRLQIELVSPGLTGLLNHLNECPIAELEQLLERLRKKLGKELPVLWTTSLQENFQERQSERHTRNSVLYDLTRRPHDRKLQLSCAPLILRRDGEDHYLPSVRTTLKVGDEILFCGARREQLTIEAILENPYTFDYLVSGIEPPRSFFARAFEQRRVSA